jgi:hypothetical protein
VAATKDRIVKIDWQRAEQIFLQASGVPEALQTEAALHQTAGAQK